MAPHSKSQAGEGKIGCLVSLVVLVIMGGVAYKLVPPYYAKNRMISAAEDTAIRAGIEPKEILLKQLKAKAAELELQEALAPDAITVSTSGGKEGTCTIRLHWTSKIDLYGVTTYDLETEATISKPYMDAR